MAYAINDLHELYKSKGTKAVAAFSQRSPSWVRWFFKKHNLQMRSSGPRSNKVDETYFEKINTPAKAYFLGLLAADGCVSLKRNAIKLSLKNEDAYILEYFREEINASNRVLVHGSHSRIEFSSLKMKSDLAKLGIVPQKTYALTWPKLQNKFYSHYIRGFIDGDGCWYIRKRKECIDTVGVSVGCVSFNFLNEMQTQLTHSCGVRPFTPRKIKIQSGIDFYSIRYPGNNLSKKIAKYVYPKNMGKFYMTRKYNICATKT